MSGCDRKGQYPYSCIECWPNRPAYWCVRQLLPTVRAEETRGGEAVKAIQAWRWWSQVPYKRIQQSYIVRVPEDEIDYHLLRIAVQQEPGLPAPNVVDVEPTQLEPDEQHQHDSLIATIRSVIDDGGSADDIAVAVEDWCIDNNYTGREKWLRFIAKRRQGWAR
jgi:hypothetical protein